MTAAQRDLDGAFFELMKREALAEIESLKVNNRVVSDINGLWDQWHLIQEKLQEVRHARDGINGNIDNFGPGNGILVPPHVYENGLIGGLPKAQALPV